MRRRTAVLLLFLPAAACSDILPGDPAPRDVCQGAAAGEFPCRGIDLLAHMAPGELGDVPAALNDVWGWADPETGREYALVGRADGASFVDVTDPASPRLVGTLPRTDGAGTSSWRDLKVYADHVFVVSDNAGAHGMQVFDLRRLRGLEGAPVVFDEDAVYTGIGSAHNLVIDEDAGIAVAVGANSGGESCGGGLHMVDIGQPASPAFLGCFADPTTGRAGTGYTHDAQCVTYDGPDARFIDRRICFGANETALSIADVTDPQAPVALATASYPQVGYLHQGWLSEDGRYFYMDDELDEIFGNVSRTRTLIWDVAVLDDPILVREHPGEATATDHNQYVVGDRLYQANYTSGLRVLDISDPEDPVEIGFFDTVPETDSPGTSGAWSVYPFLPSGTLLVSSIGEGLFILRPGAGSGI